MRFVAAACAAIVLAGAAPARAATQPTLIPPVDAPVVRGFEPPEHDYGPGHRGIDYGVVPGVQVRAAGDGVVTFAGPVGTTTAVTIDHGGGLESTYSSLGRASVVAGQSVDQGLFLGASADAHPGEWGGLHFGVKLHDRYVDPLDYLGALDVTGAIRLAPLTEELQGEVDATLLQASRRAGTHHLMCRDFAQGVFGRDEPNDNVAVVIGGINSSTRGGGRPELFAPAFGAQSLGYPDDRVYRFSYRGTIGPRFHAPYTGVDTQGDLGRAARRLETLLRAIRRRHPGVSVDLLAHSQGGIVARAYLQTLADAFDSSLPRVEHVVTFATPHEGAPFAGAVRELRADTWTGRWLLAGASRLLRDGGPLPDPESKAVRQLAPGSGLLDRLVSEDMAFGTRVLALAIPNDVVVPADHADYPGQTSRVVEPEGVFGHDAIVRSEAARTLAYAFLRDAPAPCLRYEDVVGPLAGGAISRVEGAVADAYSEFEQAVGGRIVRAVRWIGGRARAAIDRVRGALGGGK